MEKEGITDMTEFQNLFTIKAVEHLRKLGKEPKAIKVHTPLNAVYNYEPGKGKVMGVEVLVQTRCLKTTFSSSNQLQIRRRYPSLATVCEFYIVP